MQWCNNMSAQIKGADLAKDVLEAEEQVEMHNERKVCNFCNLCNTNYYSFFLLFSLLFFKNSV